MKSKKELKHEYKQMKPEMGVFQIVNQTNGKIFIDGAVNMTAKWNRHQTELRFNSHKNIALQKDWKTLGADQFVFEVISELSYKDEEVVNYQKEVKLLTEMYLEELSPFGEKGYNVKK